MTLFDAGEETLTRAATGGWTRETWRTMEDWHVENQDFTFTEPLPHESTITKADINFVGKLEDRLRDAGVSPIF